DLQGPRQLAAIEEVQAEVDNLRSAWDWAIERGEVDWLDRALEGLCLLHLFLGHTLLFNQIVISFR
ncbi:MAG: hypothetical protein P8165_07145, partial [Deltaproteobacteria bacterium]